jgi:hypothetical protein
MYRLALKYGPTCIKKLSCCFGEFCISYMHLVMHVFCCCTMNLNPLDCWYNVKRASPKQPSVTPFYIVRYIIISRASAAALSTVLRTTTLSYGNMRFSGACPAETP